MFKRKTIVRALGFLTAALLIMPTAAQGVFAAADDEISVIIETEGAPLYSSPSAAKAAPSERGAYAKKAAAKRDAALKKAAKAAGSLEVVYTYSDIFNGAAVTIRESEVKALENVPGIKRVTENYRHLLSADDVDDETLEEYNVLAKEMIDIASARGQGYEGEGTLIAVIDAGFEPDHENFAPIDDCDNKLSREDVIATIKSGALSATTARGSAYVSSKVPYHHSYALEERQGEPLMDASPLHGNHVCGIAAGNGPVVEGVAPKAQLAMMQIALGYDYVSDADVIAALSDAVALGADAINMSFSSLWDEPGFEKNSPFAEAIMNARNSGALVACAAGNEGRFYVPDGESLNYSMDGMPSAAPGATSVGAADSSEVFYLGNVDVKINGESLEYYDDYSQIPLAAGDYPISEPLLLGAPTTKRYVEKNTQDFAGAFVPVYKLSTLFGKKAMRDQLLQLYVTGAAGLIVQQTYLSAMETCGLSPQTCPLPLLVVSDYDNILLWSGGTLSVVPIEGDPMAGFSSWCFNRDLRDYVDISAPGMTIMSSVTNDRYGHLNGTSMASPFVAGAAALMAEKLAKSGSAPDGGEKAKYIENVLKNTAVPMETTDGEYVSPRRQGAGLLNIGAALKCEALLTDALRSGEADIHLGNTLGSDFSFDVKLVNSSDADKTFELSAAFTTDSYADYDEDGEQDEIVPEDRVPLECVIKGPDKPVKVPAGASVIVSVSVSLDAAQTEALSEIYPKGFFIDGFIFAETDAESLSIPATGFCGDYYAFDAVYEFVASFSKDENGARFALSASLDKSLEWAKVEVTDADGVIVWSREVKEIEYSFAYMTIDNYDEDEPPIIGLGEGYYNVKLTVLPVGEGASEQVYEKEIYYPGEESPKIVSINMIPEDSYTYQVEVISKKPCLSSVTVEGAAIGTAIQKDVSYFSSPEETEDGNFLYKARVYVKKVTDPFNKYDITVTATNGETYTQRAGTGSFTRTMIPIIRLMYDIFVDLLVFSLYVPLMTIGEF